MRLDIQRPGDLEVAVRTGKAYVETAPVVPTVVEVAVPTVASATPARSRDSRGRLLAAESSTQKVKGFLTVGATWAPRSPLSEAAISLQVRSVTKGHWTKWESLEYHNEHGPDVATSTSRPGTEPTVIGRVDGVQLRVFTKSGVAPAGFATCFGRSRCGQGAHGARQGSDCEPRKARGAGGGDNWSNADRAKALDPDPRRLGRR
ncbi:MAG: hypothetical protein V9E81_03625 [Marmoricola sp.]